MVVYKGFAWSRRENAEKDLLSAISLQIRL